MTSAGDVINVLNKLAPPSFSVLGDEEGLLVGNEDWKVSRIGIVWDLSLRQLKMMIKDRVDFIVTHTYPFLRQRAAKLEGYESIGVFPVNSVKRDLLFRNRIVLYRLHSSWDNADGGNNDVLAKLLGLSRVEKVPFGRRGFVVTCSLRKFAGIVKKKLDLKFLRVAGNLKKKISSVMVVSGTGFLFTELIDYCYREGIDVLVSGDLTKKAIKRGRELGVCLIDATPKRTELPGMIALANLLRERGIAARFYEDEDGYKYI